MQFYGVKIIQKFRIKFIKTKSCMGQYLKPTNLNLLSKLKFMPTRALKRLEFDFSIEVMNDFSGLVISGIN